MQKCPFRCGESGGTDLHVVIPYDDGGGFFVECSDCGSAGPDGDDADGAIAAWNERAQSFAGINRDVHPTSLHGEIERLTRDQDEWKDLALRNQASMENYVRRLGDSESICRVAESEITRLKDQLTAALLERDGLASWKEHALCSLARWNKVQDELQRGPYGAKLAHDASTEAIRILREQLAMVETRTAEWSAADKRWRESEQARQVEHAHAISEITRLSREQAAEIARLNEALGLAQRQRDNAERAQQVEMVKHSWTGIDFGSEPPVVVTPVPPTQQAESTRVSQSPAAERGFWFALHTDGTPLIDMGGHPCHYDSEESARNASFRWRGDGTAEVLSSRGACHCEMCSRVYGEKAPPAEAPMPRLESCEVYPDHHGRVVIGRCQALAAARADLAEDRTKIVDAYEFVLSDVRDRDRKRIAELERELEVVKRQMGIECEAKHVNAQAAWELAELRGRLEEWCCTVGEELCPPGADTYGEGVRESKSQVALLLHLDQPAGREPCDRCVAERNGGSCECQHTDKDGAK